MGTGTSHLPRTRGDKPVQPRRTNGRTYIYPAHAGINRDIRATKNIIADLPRTRGDKPPIANVNTNVHRSTPHTRG